MASLNPNTKEVLLQREGGVLLKFSVQAFLSPLLGLYLEGRRSPTDEWEILSQEPSDYTHTAIFNGYETTDGSNPFNLNPGEQADFWFEAFQYSDVRVLATGLLGSTAFCTAVVYSGNSLASQVEFTPTAEILSTNVQDAIEEVQDHIPDLSNDYPQPAGVYNPGTSTTVSRSDHVHPAPAPQTAAATSFTPVGNVASTNVQAAIAEVSAETPQPSDATPLAGGSADPGVSAEYSRADHVHPGGAGGSDLEVLDEGVSLSATATSIDFVGAGVTATAVGDAITVTIPGGSGAAPSNATPLAPSGAGTPGVSALYSRGDHVHPVQSAPVASQVGITPFGTIAATNVQDALQEIVAEQPVPPSPATVAPANPGPSPVIGVQTRYAREDHAHQSDAPLVSNANPLAHGTAAQGSSARYSRQDHVHPSDAPLPATATPLVESGVGAVGTATRYAREDHVHPAAGGGGGVGTLLLDVATTVASTNQYPTLFTGAYNTYVIELDTIEPSGSGAISFRWAIAGAIVSNATGYSVISITNIANGSTDAEQNAGNTAISIGHIQTAGQHFVGRYTVSGVNNNRYKSFIGQGAALPAAGSISGRILSGQIRETTALTGFGITCSGGNFNTFGRIRVWGYA